MISIRLYLYLAFLSFVNIGVINSILVFWPANSLEGGWILWVYPVMLIFYHFGSFCGLLLMRILGMSDCIKTSILSVIVSCVLTALSPDVLSISTSLVLFLGIASGLLSFFILLSIIVKQNEPSLVFSSILAISTLSSIVVPEISYAVMNTAHWRLILLLLALSLSIGLLIEPPEISNIDQENMMIDSYSSKTSIFIILSYFMWGIADSIPPFIGLLSILTFFNPDHAIWYIIIMATIKVVTLIVFGWIVSNKLLSPLTVTIIGNILMLIAFIGFALGIDNKFNIVIQNILYQCGSASYTTVEASLSKRLSPTMMIGVATIQAVEGISAFIGSMIVFSLLNISYMNTIGLIATILSIIFSLGAIRFNLPVVTPPSDMQQLI